jgi:dolichol-phosphate mannosyltransferase
MDADMLNNTFTYRDRRLRGRRLRWGLATFYAACVVRAVLSVGIAGWIRDSGFSLTLAGAADLIAGAVWNRGATSMIARRSSRYHPPKGAAA